MILQQRPIAITSTIQYVRQHAEIHSIPEAQLTSIQRQPNFPAETKRQIHDNTLQSSRRHNGNIIAMLRIALTPRINRQPIRDTPSQHHGHTNNTHTSNESIKANCTKVFSSSLHQDDATHSRREQRTKKWMYRQRRECGTKNCAQQLPNCNGKLSPSSSLWPLVKRRRKKRVERGGGRGTYTRVGS